MADDMNAYSLSFLLHTSQLDSSPPILLSYRPERIAHRLSYIPNTFLPQLPKFLPLLVLLYQGPSGAFAYSCFTSTDSALCIRWACFGVASISIPFYRRIRPSSWTIFTMQSRRFIKTLVIADHGGN